MSGNSDQARQFLAGANLTFEDVDKLWQALKKEDEIPLARAVLERLRKGECLLDDMPGEKEVLDKLYQQEALLTSKDPELGVAVKHRSALEILKKQFRLDDPKLNDPETLGIAGSILRRQWEDLGQLDDLRRSAEFYRRGAGQNLGEDAYAHINAAFLEDLLASLGDNADARKQVAVALRSRIVAELQPVQGSWWNAATRAEARFGLGMYSEAAEILESATRGTLWEIQSTTRQFATLAYLREPKPSANPEIRRVFGALLPQAAGAVRSAFIGKVGLALSGGGFRASFYHLGVLARFAELNVLRHIDVLSCVSGGSIIGACYRLVLRKKLLESAVLKREDYVAMICDLIGYFKKAVSVDVRAKIQPHKAHIAFNVLARDQRGAIDPEKAADELEESFFGPLWPGWKERVMMNDLQFTPNDHDALLTGSAKFNPTKHNWLRENKVPSLILNATTVNTGRGWQFTPTWMGESPWAINEGADNIERLEWAYYAPEADWQISLAQAVAASAAVPGVFKPLELKRSYAGFRVQLVDGGVYDNQGVVSLLAANCNVLLVSDASGQLLLQRESSPGLAGLKDYALRAMDILMERIRQANFGDLSARRLSGQVRGLMFVHMKAGLDADTVRLPFSQESFELKRSALSPYGVRKDFLRALAELRTDLDAFTDIESDALMACGYQMASRMFQKDIAKRIPELWEEPGQTQWPFDSMLNEIMSPLPATAKRARLLEELAAGSKVDL
jgi:predicted acylesterase/phospholipase RssA